MSVLLFLDLPCTMIFAFMFILFPPVWAMRSCGAFTSSQHSRFHCSFWLQPTSKCKISFISHGDLAAVEMRKLEPKIQQGLHMHFFTNELQFEMTLARLMNCECKYEHAKNFDVWTLKDMAHFSNALTMQSIRIECSKLDRAGCTAKAAEGQPECGGEHPVLGLTR